MNSSCGFNLQGSKHSGSWGSYYFGDSWQTCSSDYTTIFGCTNTTYSDKQGNPGGDTVFVTTNCSTNERLHDLSPNGSLHDSQDPRYLVEAYGGTALTVADPTTDESYTSVGDTSEETCDRACLCGYSLGTALLGSISPLTIDSPYDACDCQNRFAGTFVNIFFRQVGMSYRRLASMNGLNGPLLPVTKANLSLLRYYGQIPCNASLSRPGLSYPTNLTFDGGSNPYTLVSIPDGDNRTILNPYECFGTLSTIHQIMDNYTRAKMLQSAATILIDLDINYTLPIPNACQCCSVSHRPGCVSCND